MIDKKQTRSTHNTETQTYLSDVEITQILLEAAQQYEEYKRLADLAKLSDVSDECYPRYDWSKPIGLTIEGPLNAKLV